MMAWVKCSERLPDELTHVVCYCPGLNGQVPGRDWMDSDYCIGEHINGVWKKVDNENIAVFCWMAIPEPTINANDIFIAKECNE